MAKNNIHYEIDTAIASVPADISKAGTLDSVDVKVTGTGTAFKSDGRIREGDWIYDPAQAELRKIKRIIDDENLVLEDAFTSDLSGVAFRLTYQSRAKEISVTNVGLANATIDGGVFEAGISKSITKGSTTLTSQNSFVDPIVVDASSTVISVMEIY